MKILVDADACPKHILEICKKLARHFGIPVLTVASFHHLIESDAHVIVGDDPQETDLKIIHLTEAGDAVITQDWGLAAVVLGKGARSIHPAGWEFLPQRMPFLLEEREVKAKHRRSGGRTKGPRKRTSENDRRFELCLEKVLAEQKGAEDVHLLKRQ